MLGRKKEVWRNTKNYQPKHDEALDELGRSETFTSFAMSKCLS